MIVARAGLILAGLALGGYGALLLVDNPWPILINIGIWAAAGVILHDFVFAPACVGIGLVGRRLIPRTWWTPFALAALLSVVLVLLAVPVYDRPGARPDNPTVLDHDYHRGVWILLALVWACAGAYIPARRLMLRIRDPRPGLRRRPARAHPGGVAGTQSAADEKDPSGKSSVESNAVQSREVDSHAETTVPEGDTAAPEIDTAALETETAGPETSTAVEEH